MRGKITALLIFHQPEPCHHVAAILEKLGVPTGRAQTLAEACRILARVNPPLLVLTETVFNDLPPTNP